MENNRQILTYEIFRRICDSYERSIAFSANTEKVLEDNLDCFSDFVISEFKRLNLVASENFTFQGLYTLYQSLQNKIDVNLSDVAKTSSAFYQFVTDVQNAGFDMVDDSNTFKVFVSETTSAENLSEETVDALYTLFKLQNSNRKLFPAERDALKKALTDKKENLNLRKMHRVRDFIIKKGGTLLTIAAGAFTGAVIGTMAVPAGFGGFVTSHAALNAITFGSNGLLIGAGLAYAGIKIKNAATKHYYKKKYNITRKEVEGIEDGLIEAKDLKIIKLLEKTAEVNAKVLELKEPLPKAKGIFGKMKNAVVGFGRKIKRNAINAVNRNRIHTISDELNIVNKEILDIQENKYLSENEKAEKIARLNEIRRVIASARAEELMNAMAKNLILDKRHKFENLDIYAKDLLPKKDRKNKRLVRQKALEILRGGLSADGETEILGLLGGDITALAGARIEGCDIPLVIERQQRMLNEAEVIHPTFDEVAEMVRLSRVNNEEYSDEFDNEEDAEIVVDETAEAEATDETTEGVTDGTEAVEPTVVTKDTDAVVCGEHEADASDLTDDESSTVVEETDADTQKETNNEEATTETAEPSVSSTQPTGLVAKLISIRITDINRKNRKTGEMEVKGKRITATYTDKSRRTINVECDNVADTVAEIVRDLSL